MNTFVSLLPLLFSFVVIACFVKLAARLLRRTAVSWKNSFLFGLLMVALAIAKSLTGFLLAAVVPPVLALVLGLAISLAIGAWFFNSRAVSANGDSIGWRGGLQLTGLAYGLMLAIFLPLFVLVNVLLPAHS